MQSFAICRSGQNYHQIHLSLHIWICGSVYADNVGFIFFSVWGNKICESPPACCLGSGKLEMIKTFELFTQLYNYCNTEVLSFIVVRLGVFGFVSREPEWTRPAATQSAPVTGRILSPYKHVWKLQNSTGQIIQHKVSAPENDLFKQETETM